MEGSVDADEWRCRLMTAAVVVQEASRKPTDDVFFDAAAVGPRAAAAAHCSLTAGSGHMFSESLAWQG